MVYCLFYMTTYNPFSVIKTKHSTVSCMSIILLLSRNWANLQSKKYNEKNMYRNYFLLLSKDLICFQSNPLTDYRVLQKDQRNQIHHHHFFGRPAYRGSNFLTTKLSSIYFDAVFRRKYQLPSIFFL